jgi:hypothetical protein
MGPPPTTPRTRRDSLDTSQIDMSQTQNLEEASSGPKRIPYLLILRQVKRLGSRRRRKAQRGV